MATFQVSKKIQVGDNVTLNTIQDFLKLQLEKGGKLKILSETDGDLQISGRVKETFLTPVTKYTANIKLSLENGIAKIHSTGSSKVNAIFWSMVTVGLLGSAVGFTTFFVPIIIVPGVLFFVQQKHPQALLEASLRAAEVEYDNG